MLKVLKLLLNCK